MKNYVQLIGRLGGEPEIRTTANGKQTARFSVATDNFYTNDKGERVKQTTWHRIVSWNKTAELMDKLLKKGTQVMIEGSLQYRTFEDKEGITRNFTEVIAQRFIAL